MQVDLGGHDNSTQNRSELRQDSFSQWTSKTTNFIIIITIVHINYIITNIHFNYIITNIYANYINTNIHFNNYQYTF